VLGCLEFNGFIDDDLHLPKTSRFFNVVLFASGFPVLKEYREFENILKYIYPLQQYGVYKLLKYLNEVKPGDVKQVIIFGSSVDIRCNYHSDLDISIEFSLNCADDIMYSLLNEVKKVLMGVLTDIIIFNELEEEEPLRAEIKKGVVIYEQDLS